MNIPSTPTFANLQQDIVKYNCKESSFKLSSLSEFYKPVEAIGFAIKYVADGNERYFINGQMYDINSGNYLLLKGDMDAKVEIESRKNVKGICINIAKNVVEQAVASFRRPDTIVPDVELSAFFCTDAFLENQYRAASNELGKKINRISNAIKQQEFLEQDINQELFFDLAEKLVTDQITVYHQLQSVHAVKSHTRRDVYRRLTKGREFMDACFHKNITIEKVARETAMSEFHFFRMFKMTFGISPYQYILKKRLEAAHGLLMSGETVSNTAFTCGFTDIFSFSKSYKKHYGIPPSSV